MRTLLRDCLCVLVCVLVGVPVCKRLRCVHVNKHALLLVGRTCVANLLKTCNDHYCAPIRTRTSKRLPSKLTKELYVKIIDILN